MRFFGYSLIVGFLGLLAAGCNVVNPSEKVPTYIHIDSFQFVPTANTGTQSHKINSVWVYFDNAALGAFDLPANVPLLTDHPGKLQVYPGVVYSGLNDVIVPYPFYQPDTMTISPRPGQTISYLPKTSYYDTLVKTRVEDFESGNSFVLLGGDTLKKTTDPRYVYEGVYGGLIELNNGTYSESIMAQDFQSPTSGSQAEVYLELNYKGTLDFHIGVQTTDGSQAIISYLYGFKARSDWNKVYIGLQDFIGTYPNKTYRIMVKVSEDAPTTGYVAFDNFKVISKK